MKRGSILLPNGLSAIVAEQHANPVVSVQIYVGTGSMFEGEYAGAGISHLLEHMVFKGTQEFSGSELNERVAAMGGIWNAYTSTDRTVFHIDGPAEHWRDFLHILCQLVFHPSFPREEFENEREVIRREMAMYNDDPQDFAYRHLVETLYKIHPRRLPVIGYRDHFDRLTYEDMLAYHRANYIPQLCFCCAAGDVNSQAFFEAVRQEAGDLAPAPLPLRRLPEEPRQWGPRLCRAEFAQPDSSLMLAWRIPDSRHPDAAALSLLNSVLGEGRSARLYKRFHDESGQAHDISCSVMPARSGEGAFVVEVDCDRDERDTLRREIPLFLQSLAEADFSADILRARRQLKAARMRQYATVQGLAAAISMAWQLSRNLDCMEEWSAALEAVSNEDIQGVIRRYLLSERLCELSIDPLGSNPAAEDDATAQKLEPPVLSTLANGLRLVCQVDRRIPMAYASMAVGAGCQSETAENAGINSLMAECMLKGTATRNSAQVAEALEQLGGSIASDTGNNSLSLSARCLTGDEEAMIELMADVALRPSFPAEAVETEKEAMIADVEDNEEDPAAVAFRRLRRACFGNISYGNHPDGSVESLQSLTPEKLKAQHARLLCGCNCVLAVMGDIDVGKIRAMVEKHFAAMPAGQALQRCPSPAQQAADLQIRLPKEQAVLALALPAESATSPALLYEMLLDEWCRDMAGPVFAEIREKRGLAYYASSSSFAGTDCGCLYFYLACAPDKLAEARRCLEETLARLAREGMPAEALERARATALAGRLLSMQSGKKLAAGMAVNCLLGSGANYDEEVPALIRSVRLEEMQAFIRRVLSPKATHTWVSVSPDAVKG